MPSTNGRYRIYFPDYFVDIDVSNNTIHNTSPDIRWMLGKSIKAIREWASKRQFKIETVV